MSGGVGVGLGVLVAGGRRVAVGVCVGINRVLVGVGAGIVGVGDGAHFASIEGPHCVAVMYVVNPTAAMAASNTRYWNQLAKRAKNRRRRMDLSPGLSSRAFFRCRAAVLNRSERSASRPWPSSEASRPRRLAFWRRFSRPS